MGTHPIFESDFDCLTDGPDMSSGTKKIEAPEISSGAVVGKVRKSESRKSKRIGKRKEDLYSGDVYYKDAPQDSISGALQLGITTSVGSHSTDRDVLIQDFEIVESIYFPKCGTTQTAPHKFEDFRFKSYAPLAFRFFRDIFDISVEDFLNSIGAKPLVPMGNPGASGSCFWVTHDDEFIVKTVSNKEAHFLQKLLPGYYLNLDQNPRTLLPKFYGFYCISIGGRNIRVCVMNNLLPRRVKMDLKFDLKGSTFNRKASKKEREKSSPTYKDLDLMEILPNGLELDYEIYEAIRQTIKRDIRVLNSFKIMDYSLLIGIHNVTLHEKEKKQSQTSINTDDGTVTLRKSSKAQRDARKNHVSLNPTALQNILPNSTRPERLIVASDPWGGIPAKNRKGERLNLYLGIIDILQCYKTVKKLEHAWKALLYDGDTVSVHRPSFYSERFERFMFGKVFVSLPMTESLRRLNAQNKQRPKLKKTPEEDIKNLEIEEISVETPESPSNEISPTNEISPSNEQNIENVPQTESTVTEPNVTEIEQKTSNEINADKNDQNLQKESSFVTNVVTTTVTVPNQADTIELSKESHVTVSDEGDAKQNDQFLSQKIDTSSAEIIREQVPKLKDEA